MQVLSLVSCQIDRTKEFLLGIVSGTREDIFYLPHNVQKIQEKVKGKILGKYLSVSVWGGGEILHGMMYALSE